MTLAQRAVELSGVKRPEILRTLAAAYAETGRFAEAVQTAVQGPGPRRATEQADSDRIDSGHDSALRSGETVSRVARLACQDLNSALTRERCIGRHCVLKKTSGCDDFGLQCGPRIEENSGGPHVRWLARWPCALGRVSRRAAVVRCAAESMQPHPAELLRSRSRSCNPNDPLTEKESQLATVDARADNCREDDAGDEDDAGRLKRQHVLLRQISRRIPE